MIGNADTIDAGNGGRARTRTLAEKLEAAKEKAELKDFEVTITETLQITVTVRAKDQCDAELMVQDAWDNAEYILDADHFKGVSFDASPVEKELRLSRVGDER